MFLGAEMPGKWFVGAEPVRKGDRKPTESKQSTQQGSRLGGGPVSTGSREIYGNLSAGKPENGKRMRFLGPKAANIGGKDPKYAGKDPDGGEMSIFENFGGQRGRNQGTWVRPG